MHSSRQANTKMNPFFMSTGVRPAARVVKKRTDYAQWDKKVTAVQAQLRSIRTDGTGANYRSTAKLRLLCEQMDARQPAPIRDGQPTAPDTQPAVSPPSSAGVSVPNVPEPPKKKRCLFQTADDFAAEVRTAYSEKKSVTLSAVLCSISCLVVLALTPAAPEAAVETFEEDEESGVDETDNQPRLWRSATVARYQTEYPWIVQTPQGMLCSVCRGSQTGIFATVPFTDTAHAREKLKKHHATHKSTMNIDSSLLGRDPQQYHRSVFRRIVNIVFFLSKTYVATYRMKSFLEFFAHQLDNTDMQKWCGQDMHYLSHQSVSEWLLCLQDVLVADIRADVKQAGWWSLAGDSSRDISKAEQVVTTVRYVKNGQIEERIIDIRRIKQQYACDYAVAIIGATSDLAEIATLTGVSFDGASSMAGKYGGAHLQIRALLGASAFFTWCHAHRLQLVVLDSKDEVPQISDVFNTLRSLWVYTHASYQRLASFRENLALMADLIDGFRRDLIEPSDTRWLSAFAAIAVVVAELPAILPYFRRLTLEGELETQALLTRFESPVFIACLYLLYDVLELFNTLCLILQSKAINVFVVQQKIDTCRGGLFVLAYSPGNSGKKYVQWVDVCSNLLGKVVQAESFQHFHEKYAHPFLLRILKEFDERFPASSFFRSLAIFDTRNLPTTTKELTEYGNTELKSILSKLSKGRSVTYRKFDVDEAASSPIKTVYKKTFVEHTGEGLPLLQNFSSAMRKSFLNEWALLKGVFASSDRKGVSWDAFFKHAEVEDMPHLRGLFHLLLSIPLTSVTCERGFSLMKIIKTRLRSRMTDPTLCSHLLIADYPMSELPADLVEKTIDAFVSMKNRMLAVQLSK